MCIVMLFIQATPAYALTESTVSYSINKAYDYPITPDDEKEWAQLTTLNDKLNACQIPEDILNKMTTPALIETVANYPLSVNLYAFDTLDLGYQMVKGSFNGLAELEKRMQSNPQEVKAVLNTEIKKYSSNTNEEKNTVNDLNYYFIKRVEECLGRNSSNMLDQYNAGASIQPRSTSSYVTTPKGSRVTAIKDQTWSDTAYTQSEVQASHNAVKSQYPSVTIISGISPKYNCHSYAWHSTSTSNQYWINNPSLYISDGSYKKASVYRVGSKLTYTSNNTIIHSGIISGVSDNHLTYVTSKWGLMGVYKHLYYDCPYSTNGNVSSSVSSYVRNS